jgi:hypothetical protein
MCTSTQNQAIILTTHDYFQPNLYLKSIKKNQSTIFSHYIFPHI